MQTVRIALIAFLTACSTSAAWAQYGLYGSPTALAIAAARREFGRRGAHQLSDDGDAGGSTSSGPGPGPGLGPGPGVQLSAASAVSLPRTATGNGRVPAVSAGYAKFLSGSRQPAAVADRRRRTGADESADSDSAGSSPRIRRCRSGPGSTPAQAPAAGYTGPATQGSGLMNQMLTDQNAGGCANANGGCIAGP